MHNEIIDPTDPEERHSGVHIIIVPQKRGPTWNLKLPAWAFNFALAGGFALVLVLIGGVLLTAHMGYQVSRLRAIEAENKALRTDNARLVELEARLRELDAFRQRVIELAGVDKRTKVQTTVAPDAKAKGAGPSRADQAQAIGPAARESSPPSRWPVDGVISKDFKLAALPDKEHHGLDIAASHGTPVRAAGAGVVAFAGLDSIFGQLIIIEHGDGLQSLYGHNSILEIGAGDWVQSGQQIARVGSTGESSAPHLHFEVRRDGTPIDPREYLTR
jgi:murein DD-endopeptidase MepM/ murein hydrolase activator NlpD